MDIESIKSIGDYDDILINGYISPLNKHKGISIYQESSFIDSVNMYDADGYNSIANLHLVILGCKRDRQYTVAYADIWIINNPLLLDIKRIQSEEIYPNILSSNEDVERLTSVASLVAALKKEKHMSSINAAIVDKVYVYPDYRHMGISTWIHNNISDLLRKFTLITPDIVVLNYGDFSNEALAKFNMTYENYKKYLHNMYKNIGYKDLSVISKLTYKSKMGLMYKLV